MIVEDPKIISCSPDSFEKRLLRRTVVGGIVVLPGVAALIVLLFLVMGHTRLSQTGTSFISSLMYSFFIGVPSAVALSWISIRYTTKLGKLVLLLDALVLIVMAALGSLATGFALQLIGFTSNAHYWQVFRTTFPFCLVITLVVGLSMTTYQTLRHQLQFAILELRTRQMEQERANKLLAEARLSSLESRIHPHFLFNTLNSIAALIPSNPQRAEDTVGKLSSLLRFSLTANHNGLIPLAQEVKFVRDYLDIETTRFGTRLRYHIDVSPSMLETSVPPLALQCLVENAVKHVVAQRSQGATIGVSAQASNGVARLEVTDDGPGFTLESVTPEHGLGNLIARLELLFGNRAKLFVSRRDSLTVVGFEFPTEALP